jgi:hypothetical protein
MSSTTKEQPTIVFVGGSWHIPAHYDPITDRLRDTGRRVVSVRLPSNRQNGPFPKKAKSFDAGAVASAVLTELDEGREVVLIMHSYGGVAGSEGISGLTKSDRQKAGLKGGVVQLIYVTALIMPKGIIPDETYPMVDWVALPTVSVLLSSSLGDGV